MATFGTVKHLIILTAGLWLFASCGDDATGDFKKEEKEISHAGENNFHFDTIVYSGNDSHHYALDLKPIPGYYVMGQAETDSFFEAHFYEDMYLVFRKDQDSLYISKDSLTPFVNEAYLNEAMIEDIHLMIFEPSAALYLFEFAVRKPLEDDRFHFQVFMEKGQHQINIVDE